MEMPVTSAVLPVAGRPMKAPWCLHFLADLMARHGEVEDAAALYRRLVPLYEKQLPPDHPNRLAVEAGLRRTAARPR